MNATQLARLRCAALVIILTVILTGGFSVLAQSPSLNARVSKVRAKSITIRWDHVESNALYAILYRRVGSGSPGLEFAGDTFGISFTLSGLLRGATYIIEVDGGNYVSRVTASTLRSTTDKEGGYTPPPVTCPFMPPRVVITGYAENTQCQMVGEAVIAGQPDLEARGFIEAVDVWNTVNGGPEVCFTYHGWIVFLDAAYAPRMAMELAHTHRNGLTCGTIDRAGTVVMLAKGPSPGQPETELPAEAVAQPVAEPLPAFNAIPLADCQIKLMETLYLRAAPAGEIIGLVWLNSEVPAFEIYGYWYKIAFEGQTGYISRYHREVLRGGCG